MTEPRRGPVVLEIDRADLPDAPSPADAPPPLDDDMVADSAGARAILAAGGRSRGMGLGKMLLAALGSLLLLWFGVAIADFVGSLMDRRGWLGWLALVLAVATLAIIGALILREVIALARLGRIGDTRDKAVEAVETGSSEAGRAALDGLRRLYRGRSDLDWARERMDAAADDTPDIAARLAIAEREMMTPLDTRAQAAVSRASRDVAAATALIPLAVIDVLAALAINLRMMREIAEVYGGRAGLLGSWRLMRAVASHLVATGAVAVADDVIGPLVGGGMLARVSRRFGEGAINGALTARVGVAAIEVCRPLPFMTRKRPNASALILNALRGWQRDTKAADVKAE